VVYFLYQFLINRKYNIRSFSCMTSCMFLIHQVSISLTFYARIFRTKVWRHLVNYFLEHTKRQQKAKWPNYFLSGKHFQKRPNGNPELRHKACLDQLPPSIVLVKVHFWSTWLMVACKINILITFKIYTSHQTLIWIV